MNDFQKSDHMLCNYNAYLQYKDASINDKIFVDHMSKSRRSCIRDIAEESKMFLTPSSRIYTCSPKTIETCMKHYPNQQCPHEWTPYTMNEFLLLPCSKPTYKNYLVFDDTKICSKSHQVLNNWTKRKDVTTESNFGHVPLCCSK